jgi:hypothetical protein
VSLELTFTGFSPKVADGPLPTSPGEILSLGSIDLLPGEG